MARAHVEYSLGNGHGGTRVARLPVEYAEMNAEIGTIPTNDDIATAELLEIQAEAMKLEYIDENRGEK
jgi:hypothetical protein